MVFSGRPVRNMYEFAGRRNLGEVAKLYMKMEKENTMKEEVA